MLTVLQPGTGDATPDRPTPVAAAHPIDPAAVCRCDLESWAGPGGEILVVRVSGELDMLTRPIVADNLLDAVSRAPRHLVVDLAAMTFCCAGGYRLLAETAILAGARGAGFALSGLTAHQCRVINLILAPPGPARHRSVAAAVTTLRAAHAHPPVRP